MGFYLNKKRSTFKCSKDNLLLHVKRCLIALSCGEMEARAAFLLLISSVLHLASGDIYLHNPRGSNNRWNENGRPRNNANRMFDSENNNRGGYNVGSLYYTVGSTLQVEWTNQHSCGNENADCDVIIQYACGDKIRDGTTTATIPRNPAQCQSLNCNDDLTYGMHEDFYSYKHCRFRTRNKGLFTSTRTVGSGAHKTRQNNNGAAFGYECSEERDYYPYWGPSMWKDVAVFTGDFDRCEHYRSESQNVKERFYCKVDLNFLYQNNDEPPNKKYIPITEKECNEFTYKAAGADKNATWTRIPPHGIAEPECLKSHFTRDNHLGNTVGGQTPSYNWTIPNDVSEHCVLRIRYNITTGEFDRDTTDSTHNNRKKGTEGPDVWTRFGLTKEEGETRGYRLVNDPNLDVFGLGFDLQIAVDTSQFGRTFQDRSHTFGIRKRPEEISDDVTISNLNVRGKRGNIVQVFPGVEYDFTPNTVVASLDNYVHTQWTGSDNNPNNNAGQGKAGTDRSNIALLKELSYAANGQENMSGHASQFGNSIPRHIDEVKFAGFTREDLVKMSVFSPKHLGGDMDELDDSGTYFDLGPRKVTRSGEFHFMCMRNNNFSNRSQKGKLHVLNGKYAGKQVDNRGGKLRSPEVTNNPTAVEVPPLALQTSQFIELWEQPTDLINKTRSPPFNDYVTNMITINPQEKISDSNPLAVEIKLTGSLGFVDNVFVYRRVGADADWFHVEVDEVREGKVMFRTPSGGHFVVAKTLNASHVAVVVIAVLISVIVLAVVVYNLMKKDFTYFKHKI